MNDSGLMIHVTQYQIITFSLPTLARVFVAKFHTQPRSQLPEAEEDSEVEEHQKDEGD